MKEVMAIIRMNTMNETKRALSEAGFSSMTARKVFGRGKKKISLNMIEDLLEDEVDAPPRIAEAMSESHRLLAKRLITLIVNDEQADEVVKIIVEKNQTGSMGDGKIFVLPISDVIRVRTGESGKSAV